MFVRRGRARVEIATERLVLRPPEMGDFEAWAALRRQSAAFLRPWEPRWSADHLSYRAFRNRVVWADRTIRQGEALPLLLFQRATRRAAGAGGSGAWERALGRAQAAGSNPGIADGDRDLDEKAAGAGGRNGRFGGGLTGGGNGGGNGGAARGGGSGGGAESGAGGGEGGGDGGGDGGDGGQRARAGAPSTAAPAAIPPGALIGGLTLSNIRREPAEAGTLGYWTGLPFARLGFMREALEALTEHAFGPLGLSRLEAACLPDNAASRALLERCGFKYEGVAQAYLQIDGRWRNHVLYAALRTDRRGPVED